MAPQLGSLVTGGTGFIGRHLVEQLVDRRRGQIHVLVLESSMDRFDLLHRTQWRSSRRILPVVADLSAALLGVHDDWVAQHRGTIAHFFHLTACHDMAGTVDRNEQIIISGTRGALELAAALDARVLHHVSSVAVAGDHIGGFDETMFDRGQGLPSPYQAATYEAERSVRAEAAVPWRIYRPSIVTGHSQTGAMDRADGPASFFPLLKRAADSFPPWARLPSLDLGDTNIVPVDYVAKAIDHLAHVRGLDGQTFHLVNPDPQPIVDVVNTFAAVSNAPHLAVAVQRRFTSALPPALTPVHLLTTVLRTPIARLALEQTFGRLGMLPQTLGPFAPPSTLASLHTERAMAGSGISCPDLESYAAGVWDYWQQHLDETTANDLSLRQALVDTLVVITGGDSAIGRATALKVSQAGGTPLLVAVDDEALDQTRAEIEAAGGEAFVFRCDLRDLDDVDALTQKVVAEHERVDYVVTDGGPSMRVVTGLLPALRKSGFGHVVDISTVGARVVGSELSGDGVTTTTVHLPPVRIPMIVPSQVDDVVATITPAQAADLVLTALRDRPHEIDAATGQGLLARILKGVVR